jgi:hypothetical protein
MVILATWELCFSKIHSLTFILANFSYWKRTIAQVMEIRYILVYIHNQGIPQVTIRSASTLNARVSICVTSDNEWRVGLWRGICLRKITRLWVQFSLVRLSLFGQILDAEWSKYYHFGGFLIYMTRLSVHCPAQHPQEPVATLRGPTTPTRAYSYPQRAYSINEACKT